MIQVGAFEAKNTLGSLLDKVSQGEEILITRHGKPIAKLVAPVTAKVVDKQAALRAYDRLRACARELKLGPFNWEEYKKDRDEGRP